MSYAKGAARGAQLPLTEAASTMPAYGSKLTDEEIAQLPPTSRQHRANRDGQEVRSLRNELHARTR